MLGCHLIWGYASKQKNHRLVHKECCMWLCSSILITCRDDLVDSFASEAVISSLICYFFHLAQISRCLDAKHCLLESTTRAQKMHWLAASTMLRMASLIILLIPSWSTHAVYPQFVVFSSTTRAFLMILPGDPWAFTVVLTLMLTFL